MTTKNPYIAVASDMDGTLLQPNHTATKETADVLHYVSTHCKIPFVFATGRHHVDVLATKRKLGLSGYVLTSNGARVHDNNDKAIIKNDIPAALAKRLALLAIDDPDIVTSMHQEDLWLISREAEDLMVFYQDNKDVFHYHVFDPKTHASFEGVYKVYYTCDDTEKLRQLEEVLAAQFAPGQLYAAYSLPFCLEVMEGTINKGVTLGQLLDEYLFPNSDPTGQLSTAERRDKLLQQCITFGDGDNDGELLTMSGHGCVMGNAQPPLLRKVEAYLTRHPENAHKIERIRKNTENGVAEKLKEVFHISDADLAAAGGASPH